jgi:16S rRNA (guanine527-N7)-methyltransferase
MDKLQFVEMLKTKGISLSPTQADQFERYFQILVEWNEMMNLTAITEENEVYLKHFYDSISASFFFPFPENAAICDVGAGAGFPSIPIKICFPHLQISIVDSLKKRIGFLEHLTDELQLTGVNLYHDRAESFANNKNHREKYDIVTARAVARMSVLTELCLPLVKIDGTFLAMKANVEEELQKGKKAIDLLGGKIEEVHQFTLPEENSERNIVVIKKQKKSPKQYPRKAGVPSKNPLE